MSKPARKQVIIYTDGSCDTQQRIGAWAALLLHTHMGQLYKKELADSVVNTTTPRMEMTAAIKALRALRFPCDVIVYTDSQYLQRGITHWIHYWRMKNWHGVKNVDLWQELQNEAARHQITWKWIPGHSGNTYNEYVDKLAEKTRKKLIRRLNIK